MLPPEYSRAHAPTSRQVDRRSWQTQRRCQSSRMGRRQWLRQVSLLMLLVVVLILSVVLVLPVILVVTLVLVLP